jgi:hypothetical protein
MGTPAGKTTAVGGEAQPPKLLDPLRSALRLVECLRLRVQDLDFSGSQLLVQDGKGA